MRVLHIFNEIKFSGAEIMYVNAAPLFQEGHVDMIAFATGELPGSYCSYFERANIKVIHKPLLKGTKNPFTLLRYFNDVFKFLIKEQIDVIHIHRSTYYCFFAMVGHIASVKTIRTIHNVFKNRIFTRHFAIMLRLVAKKIFNVKFHTIGESVFENEQNYYRNESTVINNWYNDDKFYPAISRQEKADKRIKLDIHLDSFVIISTGACTNVKNHEAIINAVSILKGVLPLLYLHLGEGPTCKAEESLTVSLGCEDIIRFLGNQSNVRDYLIVSDVYVMPSKFEGLSIASIEAMACGLPSVLYNSPGLKDLIHDNDNGYLIEPDPKILAEKILILYENKQMAKNMGQAAQQFVNRKFSMKVGVSKIIELYCS